MSATTHHTATRRTPRLNSINAVHLAIRMLYVVVGLAAGLSLYARMLNTLGDAFPAAILTLIVAMMFLVLVNRGDRRS